MFRLQKKYIMRRDFGCGRTKKIKLKEFKENIERITQHPKSTPE